MSKPSSTTAGPSSGHKITERVGRYLCDQCKFVACHASSLDRHKTRNHCVDSSCEIKVTNNRAKFQKLGTRKYQILSDEPRVMEPVFIEIANISVLDTEIKMEEDFDDPLSLMETKNILVKDPEPDLSASVYKGVDTSDLGSKIEIKEDLVLKTEVFL